MRQRIHLEKALPEDAETLAALQKQSFAEDVERYGDGPPGYASAEWQVSSMRRGDYYKILCREHVIGGVIALDRGKGHFYIERLFISPAYQSLGAGAFALEFLEKKAPWARKWTLHTPYRNYRAQHFYRRMGYGIVGQTRPEDHPEARRGFFLYFFEKRPGEGGSLPTADK